MNKNQLEIVKVFNLLRIAYPYIEKEKNEQQIERMAELYVEMLSDIDPVLLKVAAKQVMVESRFFPSMAELRDKVAELQKQARDVPDAAQAWQQVCAAIRFNERGVGYWEHPEYCAEEAIRAAESYGITRIAIRLEDNAGTDFAQFRDVYSTVVKREESAAKMLPETREMIRKLAAQLDIDNQLKRIEGRKNGKHPRSADNPEAQEAQHAD